MQKATLGGSIEFTTAAGSIVVLIFFFFPLPSLLLGISFQKKALEVSVSKKGFLLVSVSPHIAQTVPTQRSSHPHAHVTPLSITAFPLCCRATQILQCRKA